MCAFADTAVRIPLRVERQLLPGVLLVIGLADAAVEILTAYVVLLMVFGLLLFEQCVHVSVLCTCHCSVFSSTPYIILQLSQYNNPDLGRTSAYKERPPPFRVEVLLTD